LNFGFVIDNRNCIGCHACTVACKSENSVPLGVNRTWVKYVEKGYFPDTRIVFSVMRCNHCENAPCIEICPTKALYTRPDGIVDFNSDRCIACKSCTQACPYDAIYIDPETNTAAKCNYCAHRVDVGLLPSCVTVCPTEAIIAGDMDDPGSKINHLISRQQVTVRKPEKGTRPKLFYIEGDDVSLNPLETKNCEENIFGSQSAGVGHHSGNTNKSSFHHKLNQDDKKREQNYRGIFSKNIGHLLNKGLSGGSRPANRIYDTPSKGILWGWEVAGYIFTKALAAGILGLPMLLNLLGLVNVSEEVFLPSAIASLILLGATGGLLIMDLDQPKRFFYVLLRPQWKSWLVKGGYILTIYGLLVTIFCIANLLNLEKMNYWLVLPILFMGVLLAIYTAFLFAQAKGRDFWQSPLLILHMFLHSIIGGSAVLILVNPLFQPLNLMMPDLKNIMIWAIIINLLSIFAELSFPHPTEDSHRTKNLIYNGYFKYEFWLGVIFFGSLIPVILLFWTTIPLILSLASFLILIGVWYSIRIWLIAPQMIPLS